ncbi:hypothetical protein LINPERPRIM_LOCUS30018 [Linum perenne]
MIQYLGNSETIFQYLQKVEHGSLALDPNFIKKLLVYFNCLKY